MQICQTNWNAKRQTLTGVSGVYWICGICLRNEAIFVCTFHWFVIGYKLPRQHVCLWKTHLQQLHQQDEQQSHYLSDGLWNSVFSAQLHDPYGGIQVNIMAHWDVKRFLARRRRDQSLKIQQFSGSDKIHRPRLSSNYSWLSPVWIFNVHN